MDVDRSSGKPDGISIAMFRGKLEDFPWGVPFGKLTWLWKITIFNGKINYKLPFSIAMLIYQRVIRHHFPTPKTPRWHVAVFSPSCYGATEVGAMVFRFQVFIPGRRGSRKLKKCANICSNICTLYISYYMLILYVSMHIYIHILCVCVFYSPKYHMWCVICFICQK